MNFKPEPVGWKVAAMGFKRVVEAHVFWIEPFLNSLVCCTYKLTLEFLILIV
jgi:hypothetical protein